MSDNSHTIFVKMNGFIALLSQRLIWANLFLLIHGCPLTSALLAQTLPQPEIITARQGLPQAFVSAILQDRQGFIWMATRDGLARYDGYAFKVFQPAADGRPSLSSPGLTNLMLAPDGRIWISTDQRGLDCFDPVQERFLNFSHQPDYRRNFGNDTLDTFYPDRHNRLWLSFRGRGLVRFDVKTNQFRYFTHQPADSRSLGNDFVKAIIEDKQGLIWVAHRQGLDRFDQKTNQFVHFQHQSGRPETIPDHDIQQLYRRSNGELWLQSGHYLTRWNPRTGRARSFAFDNARAYIPNQITTDSRGNDYITGNYQCLIYNDTLGFRPLSLPSGNQRFVNTFIDQSDVLWIGTDLVGVYKFNLRAASFTTRPYRRTFHDDLLTDHIGIPERQLPRWPEGTTSYNFRSAFDRTGTLWFSVGGTPIYRLEQKTNSLTRVSLPVVIQNKDQEHPILLAADPDGQIWVAHAEWSGYFDASTGRWVRFPHPLPAGVRMLQLVVDNQALWIATNQHGLFRIDRHTGQRRQYRYQVGDSTSLGSNNLYWIAADPLDSNRLWVGTFGSGLCQFDKRTGRCRRITTHQGLPNNVVYMAIPDRQGSVWVGTNKGLSQLSQRTGTVLRTYTQEDGLGADEFNRFHAFAFPDGRMVLGTIYGLTAFNPSYIEPDRFEPHVQLADIFVNNRSLLAGPLTQQQPVSQLTHLRLPHDQNFVTVQFAAMQYNRLGHTQYRYQLSGVNAGWVTTNRPEAIYTDLSPGSYQLRIQAANTAGQWSRYVRQMTLTITPPWWATGWAYAGYALLLGTIAYGLGRTWLNRLRLRQTIRLRQQEADQLRALDAIKDRFFTNITHELRTPLTLLLGATDQLLTNPDRAADDPSVRLIQRQGQQLLGLTNELLELARIEAGSVHVTEVHGQPARLIEEIVAGFTAEATRRELTLKIQIDAGAEGNYRFDAAKLERIVSNLVSNALDFTPATGQILVSLTGLPTAEHTSSLAPLSQGLQLRVADTGVGLEADQVAHIFDRFYQIDADPVTTGTARRNGTGIGLALVRELVDLQGGTITVTSLPGQGTTFVVGLPYHHSARIDSVPESVNEASNGADAVDSNADQHPLLLVVEDNPELAQFLVNTLRDTYRIKRAADGRKGLELAQRLLPDLIISDVMMPGMNGYELCQQIKTDLRTNHIPILLLTAKITLDNRLEGLSAGADDYLTKPFHVAELRLRVHNQLEQRRRTREWMRQQLMLSPAAESTAGPEDAFLNRLYAHLSERLDDAQFGVEQLADELGLSRSQLHRKVKALTDLPPSELVRAYRLKRAIDYLRQGYNSAETAYRVGFDSPPYFARCFREQYGVSPSEYVQQHL